MRSTPGEDDFNAIDPDLSYDEQGRLWMAFGSFWSGIKLRRLDPATGKLSAEHPEIHSLASRPAPGAVEGPSIVRRGGFYYLFVSFDFCCRGIDSDYRVMVGRSRSITGPYVDRDGVPMTEGGGTELLRGYNEFAGPATATSTAIATSTGSSITTTTATTPRCRSSRCARSTGAAAGPCSATRSRAAARPGAGRRTSRSSTATAARCWTTPTVDTRARTSASGPIATARASAGGRSTGATAGRACSTSTATRSPRRQKCNAENGANVAQWGWVANACQRFRFLPTSDGFVRIENEHSGRVLDAAGCVGAGADVQLWDWLGNACQEFRLEPAGDVLILDAASGRALDVRGCARRRCVWDFTHTDEGYATVTERRSGRELAVDRRGRLTLARPWTHAPATRQWALEPRNDDTLTLLNRAGGAYRVKVVEPGPRHPWTGG